MNEKFLAEKRFAVSMDKDPVDKKKKTELPSGIKEGVEALMNQLFPQESNKDQGDQSREENPEEMPHPPINAQQIDIIEQRLAEILNTQINAVRMKIAGVSGLSDLLSDEKLLPQIETAITGALNSGETLSVITTPLLTSSEALNGVSADILTELAYKLIKDDLISKTKKKMEEVSGEKIMQKRDSLFTNVENVKNATKTARGSHKKEVVEDNMEELMSILGERESGIPQFKKLTDFLRKLGDNRNNFLAQCHVYTIKNPEIDDFIKMLKQREEVEEVQNILEGENPEQYMPRIRELCGALKIAVQDGKIDQFFGTPKKEEIKIPKAKPVIVQKGEVKAPAKQEKPKQKEALKIPNPNLLNKHPTLSASTPVLDPNTLFDRAMALIETDPKQVIALMKNVAHSNPGEAILAQSNTIKNQAVTFAVHKQQELFIQPDISDIVEQCHNYEQMAKNLLEQGIEYCCPPAYLHLSEKFCSAENFEKAKQILDFNSKCNRVN
ncbi:MAG: hypothetical protein WCJ84_06640 [Candidatus Peregrinibacteria bacterium]